MRKYILAMLLATMSAPVAANDESLEQRLEQLRNEAQTRRSNASSRDWSIPRAYKSSSEHIRVIVTTTRSVTIQCAAKDSNGDPISVSRPHIINPPMDDIILRDFGKSNSASCWER